MLLKSMYRRQKLSVVHYGTAGEQARCVESKVIGGAQEEMTKL
jgi:hypothetical protein